MECMLSMLESTNVIQLLNEQRIPGNTANGTTCCKSQCTTAHKYS